MPLMYAAVYTADIDFLIREGRREEGKRKTEEEDKAAEENGGGDGDRGRRKRCRAREKQPQQIGVRNAVAHDWLGLLHE